MRTQKPIPLMSSNTHAKNTLQHTEGPVIDEKPNTNFTYEQQYTRKKDTARHCNTPRGQSSVRIQMPMPLASRMQHAATHTATHCTLKYMQHAATHRGGSHRWGTKCRCRSPAAAQAAAPANTSRTFRWCNLHVCVCVCVRMYVYVCVWVYVCQRRWQCQRTPPGLFVGVACIVWVCVCGCVCLCV